MEDNTARKRGKCLSYIPEYLNHIQFSSVQSLSCVQLFATPWTAPPQASLSSTNCWSLPKPMSIESVMPSNYLIHCPPLLLLPSVFPSIRVFSNESALCKRWPKYWSFSFNMSPSKEHQGLISFRMDWLDLLAVQGTLKHLLQHHSSKASILQCSAFFIVQLSHPYMTTGKTIALTRWNHINVHWNIWGDYKQPVYKLLDLWINDLKCLTFETQIIIVETGKLLFRAFRHFSMSWINLLHVV